MDKKGGLVLSTIILAVVFLAGFYFGMKFDWTGPDFSDLRAENEELKSQLEDIESGLSSEMLSVGTLCEDLGGRWESLGNSTRSEQVCNIPTKDSGVLCTDSSQCESFCEATNSSRPGSQGSGVCHAWRYFDCATQVVNGTVQPEICNL